MTDYKLVPVEPTPEMVCAAEDAYMPFGDMELALRMAILAAPAVQEEPTIDPYDAGSLNDFGGGDVGWWHDYIRAELDRAYEFYLIQLSAAPQPAPQPAEQQSAPDVAGLVEALTMARETIASALRANAPEYFTTDADIARHVVIQRIDAALAARREGGEA